MHDGQERKRWRAHNVNGVLCRCERTRSHRAAHITCHEVCARPRAHGYTLVELVAVIVILAIVAAIAGPKFFGTSVFSQRGYADEVASAMRYAQKIAVASGCNTQFTITLAGYAVMQQPASGNACDSASASWTTQVKRPDGSAVAGIPPSDANVSAGATITFDKTGAAVSGATNLTVGTYTLALDAASGFVVVQ